MSLIGRLRKSAFGISPAEADPQRRGFHCGSTDVAARLQRIGTEFIAGYHAALERGARPELADQLNRDIDSPFRGFAFEGAGMGLMLLDAVHLTRGALREFLAGPGDPHAYMVHVGAGWAIARLPWLRRRLDRSLQSLDPLLRWLAVDGYGFHEGYFHGAEAIRRQTLPRGVTGYAARAFDQGLGRSMWFVEGTDPRRVADTIESFHPLRWSDLWSGVGLAASYAGGPAPEALRYLRDRANEHAAALAQGAVFAGATRVRAGNTVPHTEAACRVFAGVTPEEAARIATEENRDLPATGTQPSYEVWRVRIQQRIMDTFQHRTTQ